MALAYLRFEEARLRTLHFWADIGTNAFYQYVVGDQKMAQAGVELLTGANYRSPLIEYRAANPFQSGFPLVVPKAAVKRPARYLQLWSYRDAAGQSPAVSRILEVPMEFGPEIPPDHPIKNYAMSATFEREKQACRGVPFAFAESRLSSAMFWSSLLPIVKDLAPVVLPKLANWVGGSGKGEQGKEGSNQELTQVIAALLGALARFVGPQAQAPPVAPGQSLSLSRFGARSASPGSRAAYSRAQAFPLALIPLFGEIVKTAPALLTAIGDSGTKLINAADPNSAEGRKLDNQLITGLLAQVNQQDMMSELLRYLQSQQPAPAPTGISSIPSMPSLPMSFSAAPPPTVALQPRFDKAATVSVNGKEKYVFLRNQDIRLWLRIDPPAGVATGQVIARSLVELEVKDLLSGQRLLEKRYKFKDFQLGGRLELPVSAADLAGMPAGADLLLCARFSWVGKSGAVRRADPVKCPLYLVDGSFLKGIGDAVGAPAPLLDPAKYRHFWHKIWEGDGRGARRWEVSLDAKYYTYFRLNVDTNGRVETRLKPESTPQDGEHRYKLRGRLKSGLELAASALNTLLPELSSYPSLTPDQLRAVQTDDLSRWQNQEGNYRLELKGNQNEKGAVWVYPEVTVHRLTLQTPSATNANGQVTATSEETVYFPRISHLHFLGVKPSAARNNNAEAGQAHLDGFDTEFDARVMLMPVELAPIGKTQY